MTGKCGPAADTEAEAAPADAVPPAAVRPWPWPCGVCVRPRALCPPCPCPCPWCPCPWPPCRSLRARSRLRADSDPAAAAAAAAAEGAAVLPLARASGSPSASAPALLLPGDARLTRTVAMAERAGEACRPRCWASAFDSAASADWARRMAAVWLACRAATLAKAAAAAVASLPRARSRAAWRACAAASRERALAGISGNVLRAVVSSGLSSNRNGDGGTAAARCCKICCAHPTSYGRRASSAGMPATVVEKRILQQPGSETIELCAPVFCGLEEVVTPVSLNSLDADNLT